MGDDLIDVGQVEAVHTSTGRISGYRLELRHKGLHEYRLVRAPDTYVLRNKTATQIEAWNEKWRRSTSKAAILETRLKSKGDADAITAEARVSIEAAKNLLASSLTVSHAIHWPKLKDHRRFTFERGDRFQTVKFDNQGQPVAAIHIPESVEPRSAEFLPRLSLLDKLIPAWRRKRTVAANARFEAALTEWNIKRELLRIDNRRADDQLAIAKSEFTAALRAFEEDRAAINERIEDLKARYEASEPVAVTSVAELILNKSIYPDWVTRDFSTLYISETKILILDYTLPDMEVLPSVSKATYIASRAEMRTTYLSNSERENLYDVVLYQIALRSIHELFDGDAIGAIDAVVFNGWLTWVNKGTGVEETGCLLSLQASRNEMSKIDLAKVDPKACFKKLKGISAAKLSGITPIAPIMRISTDDPRFIPSREVVDLLAEGVNLAAIDWEDFEHLVREVFEREFVTEGGEVKVTRASADGGVDAIAFDPDPIRGGKIIIQAKRYTNTVGVSAVRDLYGTMLNEGAMKGILVTTSDYGPDSYGFAKDKPITLLNGGNLLQLMEKHGRKARIDLAEARRLREAG